MKPGTPEWNTLLRKIKNNDSSVTSVDLSFLTSVVFSQNEYQADSKNDWYMALQQTGSAFQGNTAVTTLVFGGSNVYDHPCFLEYLIEILKNSAVSNLNFKSTADEVKILSDDPRVEAHFGSKSYCLSGDMPARLTKRVALVGYITMINNLLQKNTQRATSKTIPAAATKQETEALQKPDNLVKAQFTNQTNRKETSMKPGTPEWDTLLSKIKNNDSSVTSIDLSEVDYSDSKTLSVLSNVLKKNTAVTNLILGSVENYSERSESMSWLTEILEFGVVSRIDFRSNKCSAESTWFNPLNSAGQHDSFFDDKTRTIKNLLQRNLQRATSNVQLTNQKKEVEQIVAKSQAEIIKQETEALQKLDGSVKSQFASQKKEVEQIVAKSQAEIIKQETEALQKLDGSVKSQFASQ
ncbi:MAG: hypothetical protein JSS53_01755, partial [Proteobacteria bacterium]|nr:hypothetical protein [Pseudomonadota bacterium]